MSYYQKIEKGLEQWISTLEEIEQILEQQKNMTQTIHYKNETCCDKIKRILEDMKSIK